MGDWDSLFGTAPDPFSRPLRSDLGNLSSGDPALDDIIVRRSREAGVDPRLTAAVMHQESGFRANAVSPKGATGLMQLMPGTAARFGVRNPRNPDENIRGGTKYLGFLQNRFDRNRNSQLDPDELPLVLAGYNAGEGAVDKYGGVPPYRETQNYVRTIGQRYSRAQGGQLPRPDPWKDLFGAPTTSPQGGPTEEEPLRPYEPDLTTTSAARKPSKPLTPADFPSGPTPNWAGPSPQEGRAAIATALHTADVLEQVGHSAGNQTLVDQANQLRASLPGSNFGPGQVAQGPGNFQFSRNPQAPLGTQYRVSQPRQSQFFKPTTEAPPPPTVGDRAAAVGRTILEGGPANILNWDQRVNENLYRDRQPVATNRPADQAPFAAGYQFSKDRLAYESPSTQFERTPDQFHAEMSAAPPEKTYDRLNTIGQDSRTWRERAGDLLTPRGIYDTFNPLTKVPGITRTIDQAAGAIGEGLGYTRNEQMAARRNLAPGLYDRTGYGARNALSGLVSGASVGQIDYGVQDPADANPDLRGVYSDEERLRPAETQYTIGHMAGAALPALAGGAAAETLLPINEGAPLVARALGYGARDFGTGVALGLAERPQQGETFGQTANRAIGSGIAFGAQGLTRPILGTNLPAAIGSQIAGGYAASQFEGRPYTTQDAARDAILASAFHLGHEVVRGSHEERNAAAAEQFLHDLYNLREQTVQPARPGGVYNLPEPEPGAIHQATPVAPPPPVRPGPATWRNADSDVPVVVTGSLGIGPDGREYVSIQGSTGGIPRDEVIFATGAAARPAREPRPVQPAAPTGPEPITIIRGPEGQERAVVHTDAGTQFRSVSGAQGSRRRANIIGDQPVRYVDVSQAEYEAMFAPGTAPADQNRARAQAARDYNFPFQTGQIVPRFGEEPTTAAEPVIPPRTPETTAVEPSAEPEFTSTGALRQRPGESPEAYRARNESYWAGEVSRLEEAERAAKQAFDDADPSEKAARARDLRDIRDKLKFARNPGVDLTLSAQEHRPNRRPGEFQIGDLVKGPKGYGRVTAVDGHGETAEITVGLNQHYFPHEIEHAGMGADAAEGIRPDQIGDAVGAIGNGISEGLTNSYVEAFKRGETEPGGVSPTIAGKVGKRAWDAGVRNPEKIGRILRVGQRYANGEIDIATLNAEVNRIAGGAVPPEYTGEEHRGVTRPTAEEWARMSPAEQRDHMNRVHGELEMQRMRAEQEAQAARTDTKTGAGNDLSYKEAYDRVKAETGSEPIVSMIDANGLKALNDQIAGHAGGDELLKAIVTSLKDQGLVVHRVGGDEFAVVGNHEASQKEAVERALEALRKKVITGVNKDGREVQVSNLSFAHGTGPGRETADARLYGHKIAQTGTDRSPIPGGTPPGLDVRIGGHDTAGGGPSGVGEGQGPAGIIRALIETGQASVDEIRDRISNVRYGDVENNRFTFELDGQKYEGDVGDYVLGASDMHDASIALRQLLDGKAHPVSAADTASAAGTPAEGATGPGAPAPVTPPEGIQPPTTAPAPPPTPAEEARRHIRMALTALKRGLSRQPGGGGAVRHTDEMTHFYKQLKGYLKTLREQGQLDEATIQAVVKAGVYDMASLEKYLPEAVKPAETAEVPMHPVGDQMKIMGLDATVRASERVDGVDYELWEGTNGKGVVRIFNSESYDVVSINKYNSFEDAKAEYEGAVDAVRPKEGTNAETIRSNEGQTDATGSAGEGGKEPVGSGVQHPTSEETDVVGASGGRTAEESAAHPSEEGPVASKSDRLARLIRNKLVLTGDKIDNRMLSKLADEAFEGTRAQGAYTVKDMYDALEVAVHRHIEMKAADLLKMSPEEAFAWIRRLMDRIPTQTEGNRTTEQNDFQQFSTPPSLAYVASRVANMHGGDVMLEPSAGTGGLAVWARAAGAEVHTNELSARRRSLLEVLGFKSTGYDAEHINDVLPDRIEPTVVVMNPPFSATAGRTVNNKTRYGMMHIRSALDRLQEGGRLVAVLPTGVAFEKASAQGYWEDIMRDYNVRANIGLSGDEYAKYGTKYPNQLVVIDKTGPTPGDRYHEQVANVLHESAATYEDALNALEPIRQDRPEIAGHGDRDVEPTPGPVHPDGGIEPEIEPPGRDELPGPGNQPRGPGNTRAPRGSGSRGPRVPSGKSGGDVTASPPGEPVRPGAEGPGEPGPGVTPTEGGPRPTRIATAIRNAANNIRENAEKAESSALARLKAAKAGTKLPGGSQAGDITPIYEDLADLVTIGAARIKKGFANFADWSADFIDTIANEVGPEYADFLRPYLQDIFDHSKEAADLGLEFNAEGSEKREAEGTTFVEYKPAKIKGGVPHAGNLVETASMAGIEPPDVTYTPQLPGSVFKKGQLSNVQAERIIYGGQRHEQHLPTGERAGYFVGDGPGVGKGRVLSGIIADNWLQGRRRAAWISVSRDLLDSAARDMEGIGFRAPRNKNGEVTGEAEHEEIPLMSLNDFNINDAPDKDGVMFLTYHTLIGKNANGTKFRLDQLKKWLGDDGVIIFDEAHKAKNALATGGGQPSQMGQKVVQIQEDIPGARVVYSSATGATDVRNMAYMTRLGMWGPGTPFPNGFTQFMNEISGRGVGAMEMVARDLKAQGAYSSATISYKGVDYQDATHPLTPAQVEIYDGAAEAWRAVMRNMRQALGLTNAGNTQNRNAISQFWGAHQRFFKQVTTALKIPTALRVADESLAKGDSVIFNLVGTGAQRATEQVNRARAEGVDLDELNFAPTETLKHYIENAFPTQVWQDATDPITGATIKVPVVDEHGNPVHNKQALAMKNALLANVDRLALPESPLDQIVNYYGPENVAEITGRKKRIEVNPRTGKREFVKRIEGVAIKNFNRHEMNAFQNGDKKVAVISGAGSTGISLHADRTAKNQTPRHMITVELNFSADTMLQSFGRAHRTNQASAPTYTTVSTDLGGETRFAATVAKRMASIGALTKGSREAAGGGNISNFDFDSQYGQAALDRTYRQLTSRVPADFRERIPNGRNVLDDMSIQVDQNGNVSDADRVDVERFLNRILALPKETQNTVFELFARNFDETVEAAKASGQFDEGVQDLPGTDFTMKGEPQKVHEDPRTKAATNYIVLEGKEKTTPFSYDEAYRKMRNEMGNGFMRQRRSGNIVLTTQAAARTDPATGAITPRLYLHRPSGQYADVIDAPDLLEKYEHITPDEAKPLWTEKFDNDPGFKTATHHIISGVVLPVWDRLPDSNLHIVRTELADGRRIVGVEIPRSRVRQTLDALGVGAREARSPEELYDSVRQGERVKLGGGVTLRLDRFRSEPVIKVEMPGEPTKSNIANLESLGIKRETVSYREYMFIPNDHVEGPKILGRLLKLYPEIPSGGAAAPPTSQGAALEDVGSQGAKSGQRATDRIQPAPLPGGTPKKLKDIIIDFGKLTNTKIQVGKLGRRVAGSYFPGSAATVVRFEGDLDTTAHEMGHNLDDRFGVVGAWAKSNLPSPYDAELIPHFSKHGSKPKGATLEYRRAEGVAEWLRAYIMNPKEAARRAPQFHRFFMGAIDAETKAAITSFSNDVRRWYGMPSNEAALANIRMDLEKPTMLERVKSTFENREHVVDNLEMAWLDSLAPVWHGMREAMKIRGIDQLMPSKDPKGLMRRLAGINDKLSAIFERGLVSAADRNYVMDSVTDRPMSSEWLVDWADHSDYATMKKEAADAAALMVAERTVELTRRFPKSHRVSGIGGGLKSDIEQARQTIAELRSDPVRYRRLKEGGRRYREYADTVLQYMVDSGRLSAGEYRRIKKLNKSYVAFNRVMREMEEYGTAFGLTNKHVGVAGDPLKHITGKSSRQIENPFVSLLERTEKVIRESDRNASMVALRNLLTTGRQMYEGPQQDLAKIGYKVTSKDSNTIPIWINGQVEHWKFAPDIYHALKGWNEVKEYGQVARTFQTIARWMHAGVVYNPAFMVRNVIRDPFHRALVSRTGSKPWDVLRPVGDTTRERFELAGAGQAGNYLSSREAYHGHLDRVMREVANEPNTILMSPDQLRHAWMKLGEESELRGRFAEWRKAYSHAKDVLKYNDNEAELYAADQTRDILDYAVAGTQMREIARYIPFSNAGVQALARTVGAAHENPARFMTRWGMYVVAPTLLTYAWNAGMGQKTKEEYLGLPAYQRDFFWNFRVGDDTWLRIPKPFEMGVLASGVERTLDRALGNEDAFTGYPNDLLKSLMPVDESAFLGPVKGLVEAYTNYDTFRDKFIVPPRELALDLELRPGTKNASRVGQLLQKVFRVDARTIDHFIATQFGGLGRLALDVSDAPGSAEKTRRLVMDTSGIMAPGSGYSSPDVQFVLDRSKARDEQNSPGIEEFSKALRAAQDTTSPADRDRLNRVLRARARELRRKYEQTGTFRERSETIPASQRRAFEATGQRAPKRGYLPNQ